MVRAARERDGVEGQPGAAARGGAGNRREEILAIAASIFARKGVANTTVRDIAKDAGMSPVTLATAWSKQHDFVASTIVGVSKFDQLAEIFAAADLTLPDDVMKACHKVTKEIQYPMG